MHPNLIHRGAGCVTTDAAAYGFHRA